MKRLFGHPFAKFQTVISEDDYAFYLGTYYEINGEKYYALETTAPGYSVGLLKKGFRDSLVYDCGIVEMIE